MDEDNWDQNEVISVKTISTDFSDLFYCLVKIVDNTFQN